MEWVTCIAMLIASEYGCSPTGVLILEARLAQDVTFVTVDVEGYGLVNYMMPDALFADNSGVYEIH